jgi:hypothetical protein
MEQQFIAQFDRLGHGDGGGVSRRVVVVENHLFLHQMGPFFLQFGIKSAQQVGIFKARDFFTLFDVVNEDHALWIPENRSHHLSGR